MSRFHRNTENKAKVIPLVLNASFYYKKAVKAFERNLYHKALHFFRRTLELEPGNPVNHCNVAGILSEMGRYEDSIRILHHVIDEIDANFYECYLYLANNYANMGNYEKAEEYAIRYLECDPQGSYIEEAEDLLEFLSYELGRSERESAPKFEMKAIENHERARRLLENGKFLEASRILKKTIEEHPDFLPARNNLSLAYYYMGRFDKALEEAEKVLSMDQSNLHALCNLAVYYDHLGKKRWVKKLLEGLKKVYPLHNESIYKLATTMGILGEHENAGRLFYTLYKYHGVHTPALIHQIAVAAYNQGKWAEAERWWSRLKSYPQARTVAERYLRLIRSQGKNGEKLGYLYQEDEKSYDTKESILENVKDGPLLRSSLFWALSNGDEETKRQAMLLMGELADEEVEETLRQFLMKPDEGIQLKKQALYTLKKMGASLPIEMEVNSRQYSLITYPNLKSLEETVKACERVSDQLRKYWHPDYSFGLVYAERLLIELFQLPIEWIQSVRKWEGVAAAIEYLTLQNYVTKSEVAARYGVSLATLNKYLSFFTVT